MVKLLNKYRVSRSMLDAVRLVKYAYKHPMSLCLLSHDELVVYDEAKQRMCITHTS